MQTIVVNGETRQTGTAPADMPPIVVDGVEIPQADILREAQNHPAASPAGALAEAARALVVRQLLLDEARRLEIVPTPLVDDDGVAEAPDEAAIRALLEREVDVPQADEDACARFFDNNREKFVSPAAYEVCHILVLAAPDDDKARAEARAEAQRLIGLLVDDPSSFGALARQCSACPSSEDGGRLGVIGGGDTVPEFEAALARLDEGTLAQHPIETRYGFHIVRLDRKHKGKPFAFGHVRDEIAAFLEEASWRKAVQQYVAILAGQAKIEGIVLVQADTPLVQ